MALDEQTKEFKKNVVDYMNQLVKKYEESTGLTFDSMEIKQYHYTGEDSKQHYTGQLEIKCNLINNL